MSLRGVFSLPPANALVATKPWSFDAFTEKGESTSVSSDDEFVALVGAVCAWAQLSKDNTARAEGLNQRRLRLCSSEVAHATSEPPELLYLGAR